MYIFIRCVEFIININDIIIYFDVSIHMAVLLIRQQYTFIGWVDIFWCIYSYGCFVNKTIYNKHLFKWYICKCLCVSVLLNITHTHIKKLTFSFWRRVLATRWPGRRVDQSPFSTTSLSVKCQNYSKTTTVLYLLTFLQWAPPFAFGVN